MDFDKKLLFECRLLKQVVYKVRNQLGRSLQYRRLQSVYKALLRVINGQPVPDFSEILVKAAYSVLDPLLNKILIPVYSVLLSIYARVFVSIKSVQPSGSKIVSRKLKKIILLQKNLTSTKTEVQKKPINKTKPHNSNPRPLKTQEVAFNPIPEISEFLESIRNSISRDPKFKTN